MTAQDVEKGDGAPAIKTRTATNFLRPLLLIPLITLAIIIFFAHPPTFPPLSSREDYAYPPPSSIYTLPLQRPEVYMTFLASDDIPEYFTSTRVLLYSLAHSPATSDPSRPFFVHVTPRTPSSWIAQLEAEGAHIVHTPLVEGLPSTPTEPRYADCYTKLAMWNMTQFSRILFFDADHLVLKPMQEVWDDPAGKALDGVAALGASSVGYLHHVNYFSAGFMMVRPDAEGYEGLLGTTEYNPQWKEQNLLNKYFNAYGPRPWGRLDGKYERIQPKFEHIAEGIHSLHDKVWKDTVDPRIQQVWHAKLEEAEAFYRGLAERRAHGGDAGNVLAGGGLREERV
ncbi:hypothetical protein IAT38_000917 [Cryptococcus sp. DSM 104549]